MKRIIIFDKNEKAMHLSFNAFLDLLDTQVEKSWETRDHAHIETGLFKITFKIARDNIQYESVRGYKADIVINNTMNRSIEDWIPIITNMSKYK